jgi:hypothetical protein
VVELMIRWYTDRGSVGQSENSSLWVLGKGAVLLHALLCTWVLTMVGLAGWDEARYDALVQEDRWVEWTTVLLFLAAAVAFSAFAVSRRRLGDAAVGLFCIVAAGEEISWGQRVVGFTPSRTFLERNTQQEANLHNLIEAFGQPKWSLVAVIVAYGVLIPMLWRTEPGRRVLDRIGVSASPPPVAFWFLVSSLLLVWYPVRFTGEWVEAMVGALFLISAPLRPLPLVATLSGAFGGALIAQNARASAAADPAALACAREETRAVLEAVLSDSSSNILQRRGSTHRRLYTLWREADLDPELFTPLHAVECGESSARALSRREYGVDPWGTAYWVRVGPERAEPRRVTVYSFGPNRRRDSNDAGANDGDDVLASVP